MSSFTKNVEAKKSADNLKPSFDPKNEEYFDSLVDYASKNRKKFANLMELGKFGVDRTCSREIYESVFDAFRVKFE